jgi:hypothetical protein
MQVLSSQSSTPMTAEISGISSLHFGRAFYFSCRENKSAFGRVPWGVPRFKIKPRFLPVAARNALVAAMSFQT